MEQRSKCTAALSLRDGDGRPRLVGSGVCVQVGAGGFVMSAGHLLTRVSTGLWLGAAGKTVRLMGASTLGAQPTARPEIRTMNMGFAPMLPSDIDELDALEYISPAVLDLEDDPPIEEYIVIAPADVAGSTWRTMAARPAPRGAYAACGVAPATHVVVDVDHGADLPPLVGSGVWRRTTGPAGNLLTGIVVAVAVGDAGPRLVATRPGYMLMGIYSFLGIGIERLPGRTRPRRSSRRVH